MDKVSDTAELIKLCGEQELQIDKYRKALQEILTTRVMCCDGRPQGDYACDLHIEIAEQALKSDK